MTHLIELIRKDFWIGLALVLIVATTISFVMDGDLRVNDDPYGNYENATGRMIKASKGPDSD